MEGYHNYIKRLLKSRKLDQIKITDKTAYKIENVHGIKVEEVKKHLSNPEDLESVEEQTARHEKQRTFQLIFKKSSKKRLVIVITENMDSDMLFIVTAFETSKKLEKLIKRGRIRRL